MELLYCWQTWPTTWWLTCTTMTWYRLSMIMLVLTVRDHLVGCAGPWRQEFLGWIKFRIFLNVSIDESITAKPRLPFCVKRSAWYRATVPMVCCSDVSSTFRPRRDSGIHVQWSKRAVWGGTMRRVESWRMDVCVGSAEMTDVAWEKELKDCTRTQHDSKMHHRRRQKRKAVSRHVLIPPLLVPKVWVSCFDRDVWEFETIYLFF